MDRGVWTAKTVKRPRQQPAHPQCANYWAPLTRKRHTMPHSAQSQHANYWAPRTRKRHQQEHRPQRPTESSDLTQHAKGRTGDRLGPRKGATTRRNVTQGVIEQGPRSAYAGDCSGDRFSRLRGSCVQLGAPKRSRDAFALLFFVCAISLVTFPCLQACNWSSFRLLLHCLTQCAHGPRNPPECGLGYDCGGSGCGFAAVVAYVFVCRCAGVRECA